MVHAFILLLTYNPELLVEGDLGFRLSRRTPEKWNPPHSQQSLNPSLRVPLRTFARGLSFFGTKKRARQKSRVKFLMVFRFLRRAPGQVNQLVSSPYVPRALRVSSDEAISHEATKRPLVDHAGFAGCGRAIGLPQGGGSYGSRGASGADDDRCSAASRRNCRVNGPYRSRK